MRLLTITLLILFLGLLQMLFFGKNGISDYFKEQSNVESIQVTNAHMRSKNQEMYAEIADLKAGLEAIEEKARNELGMIKPKETFFRIVND